MSKRGKMPKGLLVGFIAQVVFLITFVANVACLAVSFVDGPRGDFYNPGMHWGLGFAVVCAFAYRIMELMNKKEVK